MEPDPNVAAESEQAPGGLHAAAASLVRFNSVDPQRPASPISSSIPSVTDLAWIDELLDGAGSLALLTDESPFVANHCEAHEDPCAIQCRVQPCPPAFGGGTAAITAEGQEDPGSLNMAPLHTQPSAEKIQQLDFLQVLLQQEQQADHSTQHCSKDGCVDGTIQYQQLQQEQQQQLLHQQQQQQQLQLQQLSHQQSQGHDCQECWSLHPGASPISSCAKHQHQQHLQQQDQGQFQQQDQQQSQPQFQHQDQQQLQGSASCSQLDSYFRNSSWQSSELHDVVGRMMDHDHENLLQMLEDQLQPVSPEVAVAAPVGHMTRTATAQVQHMTGPLWEELQGGLQQQGGVNQGGLQQQGGVNQGGLQQQGGVSQGGLQQQGGVNQGGLQQQGGVNQGGLQQQGGVKQGGLQQQGGVNQGGLQQQGGVNQGGLQQQGGVNQGGLQQQGGVNQQLRATVGPIGAVISTGAQLHGSMSAAEGIGGAVATFDCFVGLGDSMGGAGGAGRGPLGMQLDTAVGAPAATGQHWLREGFEEGGMAGYPAAVGVGYQGENHVGANHLSVPAGKRGDMCPGVLPAVGISSGALSPMICAPSPSFMQMPAPLATPPALAAAAPSAALAAAPPAAAAVPPALAAAAPPPALAAAAPPPALRAGMAEPMFTLSSSMLHSLLSAAAAQAAPKSSLPMAPTPVSIPTLPPDGTLPAPQDLLLCPSPPYTQLIPPAHVSMQYPSSRPLLMPQQALDNPFALAYGSAVGATQPTSVLQQHVPLVSPVQPLCHSNRSSSSSAAGLDVNMRWLAELQGLLGEPGLQLLQEILTEGGGICNDRLPSGAQLTASRATCTFPHNLLENTALMGGGLDERSRGLLLQQRSGLLESSRPVQLEIPFVQHGGFGSFEQQQGKGLLQPLVPSPQRQWQQQWPLQQHALQQQLPHVALEQQQPHQQQQRALQQHARLAVQQPQQQQPRALQQHARLAVQQPHQQQQQQQWLLQQHAQLAAQQPQQQQQQQHQEFPLAQLQQLLFLREQSVQSKLAEDGTRVASIRQAVQGGPGCPPFIAECGSRDGSSVRGSPPKQLQQKRQGVAAVPLGSGGSHSWSGDYMCVDEQEGGAKLLQSQLLGRALQQQQEHGGRLGGSHSWRDDDMCIDEQEEAERLLGLGGSSQQQRELQEEAEMLLQSQLLGRALQQQEHGGRPGDSSQQQQQQQEGGERLLQSQLLGRGLQQQEHGGRPGDSSQQQQQEGGERLLQSQLLGRGLQQQEHGGRPGDSSQQQEQEGGGELLQSQLLARALQLQEHGGRPGDSSQQQQQEGGERLLQSQLLGRSLQQQQQVLGRLGDSSQQQQQQQQELQIVHEEVGVDSDLLRAIIGTEGYCSGGKIHRWVVEIWFLVLCCIICHSKKCHRPRNSSHD